MTDSKKSFSWRKLVNNIHLWLGIGSGLILFLVCLTGTIYTFRAEIEQMLEPGKYTVEVAEGAGPLQIEQIVSRVIAETGGEVSSIEVPAEPDKAYSLRVKTSPEERRGTMYYVNPYTGLLLGTSDGPASGFFMGVFRMHRWLLMDSSIGRPIVGVATLIFVFIILTGLVLWWPKKLKNWKQGFKVKTRANWKRINHDLHNTLGFYTFFLLLIMSLTGLCWSFGWYRDALGMVLGTEVFGRRGGGESPASTIPDGQTATLSPEEYLVIASGELSYAGDYRLSMPSSPEGVVTIQKTGSGFFASSGRDVIILDQYSGEVLKIERFSDKALNEQIAGSIKPIHTGEIFGTFSKIIYFIACLIATSLPVTGTIIWINKLRKKNRKRRKTRQKSLA
ncbi:PepSY-associated TM helix domain-containing protein [Roseivirga sp. BDSF3-8]|uniref:PepSY-associated TM helix domain-containing protein n=1 Tax=Roseivirga sp. BDSF3-8 TaxID=3241598 RepID=UPI003531B1E5